MRHVVTLAMLAALVCGLIREKRVRTTLAKAKEARRLAEKMVTLGKSGSLAARRLAISRLGRRPAVRQLFDEIAPACRERAGGSRHVSHAFRHRSCK